MNLEADKIAATVLALLFSGVQFVQERFDLEWPAWTLRDGVEVPGEMRDFDWASKSLILTVEGDGSQLSIPADDLKFWSKVRMLNSAPFHDRMANHLADLEANPGFRAGMEELQRIGLTLVGAYAFLFCAVNWLLAGWILRSGSIVRWLGSGAAFVMVSGLAAALVVVCFRQFGSHQVLEYVALAACLHTVLYLALVWVIYRANLLRSFLWYGLCWLLALGLPVTLLGTVVVAQVQGHAGTLDWPACDRYLTEVWLRPMGLL